MKSLLILAREKHRLLITIGLCLSVPVSALAAYETDILTVTNRGVVGSANNLSSSGGYLLVVGYANGTSSGASRSVIVGTSNYIYHTTNSLTVGTSNVNHTNNSIVGGQWNDPMTGLGMLFGIGNGTSGTARDNVLEAYQNGTVVAPSRLLVNDNGLSTGDSFTVRQKVGTTISNSLRIKADGTVLIRQQGDIEMGEFAAGAEAP